MMIWSGALCAGLGFLPLAASFAVSSNHPSICSSPFSITVGGPFPSPPKASFALCSTAKAEGDTTSEGATVDENGGFTWDFRGHSCYSEIARPKIEENNDSSSPNPKPTLLLIHGFACSTVYWRETRALLVKQGYTVHSIDLLGFGKSSKPNRDDDGITYSIDLWAQMVDDYARRYMELEENDGENNGVVLVGNSLGSTVALSAFTGDCYCGESNDKSKIKGSYLANNDRVKGLCFYNCGVGLNTRNALKAVDNAVVKAVLNAFFDLLNLLIFNNKALLSYVIDNQVSKETLREALLSLYKNAADPSKKVDDELVSSFLDPVRKDSTEAVVEVLSQIYTNEAGRTPMEMHERHLQNPKDQIPIHLIWGTEDPIAPVVGDVGTFYSGLTKNPNSPYSGITLELVEGAGHVPFDEKPECNEGLIRWLANTIEKQ